MDNMTFQMEVPKAGMVFHVLAPLAPGQGEGLERDDSNMAPFFCRKLKIGDRSIVACDCFFQDFAHHKTLSLFEPYRRQLAGDIEIVVVNGMKDIKFREVMIKPWMETSYEDANLLLDEKAASPYAGDWADMMDEIKEVMKAICEPA